MASHTVRVLAVDDAALMRSMLAKVLSMYPDLELVGTAANGHLALQKLAQLHPDVILLDVAMPSMDGLQALREIRQSHPQLPVIMFSAFTTRGAEQTLDALMLGASDYLAKPQSSTSPTESIDYIRRTLIPKIKALCPSPNNPLASARRPSAGLQPGRPRRIDILAIGSSTGGPAALAAVLAKLPAAFPVPVVVAQHMPPVFTRRLAQSLTARCALTVREGYSGAGLEPGQVWIAPGDYHMVLRKSGAEVSIQLHQGAEENSCRPSVDVLLRSVNDVYGGSVLVLILTGMGQDGLRGCKVLRTRGAQILVQDQASSVVWGMPGLVAEAGLADGVLPLEQIASAVIQRVSAGRTLAGVARHD